MAVTPSRGRRPASGRGGRDVDVNRVSRVRRRVITGQTLISRGLAPGRSHAAACHHQSTRRSVPAAPGCFVCRGLCGMAGPTQTGTDPDWCRRIPIHTDRSRQTDQDRPTRTGRSKQAQTDRARQTEPDRPRPGVDGRGIMGARRGGAAPLARGCILPDTHCAGCAAGRVIGAAGAEVAAYQWPVFSMLDQGSAGARASPACSSSMEILSGERTKAMRPSRGGRLITTPLSCRYWQVA